VLTRPSAVQAFPEWAGSVPQRYYSRGLRRAGQAAEGLYVIGSAGWVSSAHGLALTWECWRPRTLCDCAIRLRLLVSGSQAGWQLYQHSALLRRVFAPAVSVLRSHAAMFVRFADQLLRLATGLVYPIYLLLARLLLPLRPAECGLAHPVRFQRLIVAHPSRSQARRRPARRRPPPAAPPHPAARGAAAADRRRRRGGRGRGCGGAL
jgi:hypothetical protein